MQSSGPASDTGVESNAFDAAPARLAGRGAPRPSPQAKPASTIVALSDDPVLLEALEGAAQAHAAVIISPSADRFVDQLVANAASVAVIDASSVPPPLKPFIAVLREQFPHLLLILAGPAQLQHQFTAQIDDGTIFRFAHKPASSQRLKLFIDAALRSQQPAPTLAGSFASYIPAPAPSYGKTRRVVLAVLSAVVLAAIVIAWRVSAPTPPPPQPLAAATAVAPIPVGAPVAPPVQHVAPERAPAPEPRASRAVSNAAAPAPALAAAAPAPLPAATPVAESDTHAAQLASDLQLARARLADGVLIDPPEDSARSYLESARALSPNDAQLREVSVALGEALIAKFRRAMAGGDVAAAQRWLQACSDYKINPATLSALSAQFAQLQSPAPIESAAAPAADP
jgi:hypothetical protein